MKRHIAAAVVSCVVGSSTAMAQDASTAANEDEIARELSNPVAALISVPFQFNYDRGIGPTEDGRRYLLNIQPVVPFSLTPDLNLISRTIVPVIDQTDIFPGAGSQSGLGDIVQSLFFSPARPTSSGLIYGVGPAFLLPTASDKLLGTEKWAVGPTGVILRQAGPWTVGLLANHLWSVAGDDNRSSVNASFVQPFITYITPTRTTFALNTEATRDWVRDTWTVPINFNVAQLLRVDNQILQVSVGARYWATAPDGAPSDWGLRLNMTLLFPK